MLWREGRNDAVTVQGDVVEGVQGPTVTAQVGPQLQALAAKMPPGYTLQIAGAVEESSKGQRSLLANVPHMAFIMLTRLMLPLQSFSRAMLVMLTAPPCIASVAAALQILNRPFGFVALLGFIALTAAAAVQAMIALSRSVCWGPVAVATMGGLVVATVLSLLALPALYAAWFRVKRKAQGTAA